MQIAGKTRLKKNLPVTRDLATLDALRQTAGDSIKTQADLEINY